MALCALQLVCDSEVSFLSKTLKSIHFNIHLYLTYYDESAKGFQFMESLTLDWNVICIRLYSNLKFPKPHLTCLLELNSEITLSNSIDKNSNFCNFFMISSCEFEITSRSQTFFLNHTSKRTCQLKVS